MQEDLGGSGFLTVWTWSTVVENHTAPGNWYVCCYFLLILEVKCGNRTFWEFCSLPRTLFVYLHIPDLIPQSWGVEEADASSVLSNFGLFFSCSGKGSSSQHHKGSQSTPDRVTQEVLTSVLPFPGMLV